MSTTAELIAIRRPLLMRVTGRSGLAPVVLFALVLGAVIGLGRGGPPPVWFVALGMGYLLVDCWGGLAVTSDSVQFRSILLMKKIPLSTVDTVAVVRGVGYWGGGLRTSSQASRRHAGPIDSDGFS